MLPLSNCSIISIFPMPKYYSIQSPSSAMDQVLGLKFLIIIRRKFENGYKISQGVNSPISVTSRFWIINFNTGLFPSNPGVHDTLTALNEFIRSAFTLVGAKGSSITLNRADLVSFPPGEVTIQVYFPTSEARTA
jgi:hypothetical protein